MKKKAGGVKSETKDYFFGYRRNIDLTGKEPSAGNCRKGNRPGEKRRKPGFSVYRQEL